MKLRITGVLTLAMCLALLTASAFARNTQISQKTMAHRVVTNLGGGPLPAAPAYVPPAPAVAAPAPAPSLGLGLANSTALADGGFLGHGLNSGCGNSCGLVNLDVIHTDFPVVLPDVVVPVIVPDVTIWNSCF